MCRRKWLAVGLLFLLLTSCATPYASHPIVMQGAGFSPTAYNNDLYACQNMIEQQLSSNDQADQAAGSALTGAVLGAALGAALGASFGRPGLGATWGGVGGAAGGIGAAGRQSGQRQAVYNQALAGCLTEKGYHVLGVGQ